MPAHTAHGIQRVPVSSGAAITRNKRGVKKKRARTIQQVRGQPCKLKASLPNNADSPFGLRKFANTHAYVYIFFVYYVYNNIVSYMI